MNETDMARLKRLAEAAKEYNREPSDEEVLGFLSVMTKEENPVPIALVEMLVDRLKENRDRIVKQELPAIMLENEIQSIVLDNGMRLVMKKIVSPKVLNKEKMIAWVTSIGMEDAIKTELKFQKGEVDADLVAALEKGGYSYSRDDGVHYQTLSKIVRERYENGDPLPPLDAVEVVPFDEVKIS